MNEQTDIKTANPETDNSSGRYLQTMVIPPDAGKIYCECCLKTMAKMPDKYIDLTVTSPPYNMRTRIRNGEYTTREKSEHFSKKYKYFNDDMPIDVFYNFHKKVIKELLRVSKIVCYNFQTVTGSKEAFFKIIGDYHKDIKDIVIWDKGHGQPAMHNKVLNSCYEFILILEDDGKAGRVIQNAIDFRGELDNIWRITKKRNDNNKHGAIMPEKVAGTAIKYFSCKGGLVYDPFIGSGTTALASIKLGRRWIGTEIIEEYVKMANKRLEKYLNQYSFFRVV